MMVVVHQEAVSDTHREDRLDGARLREMAHEFRRTVAARPWINQCIVAREVGARAFGVTLTDLLSKDRRHGDLADVRHRIIAFARVMTGCGYNHLARHFGRDHSAVAYACKKYESLIRTAILR